MLYFFGKFVPANISFRWVEYTHQINSWIMYPDGQGSHISWAGIWFVIISLCLSSSTF